MDALTTYRLFAANSERTLQRISSDPIVSRETEYYKENIGKIESAEELIEDTRLLNYALKAYGLEEMSYAKALLRKLLEGGTDERDALANQLTDPRYKEFVEDFNFARYGAATTSFDRTQTGVVDRFYQLEMESEAGNDNVGARLAIYFERKASGISSALEILGDRALLQVAQTALGLPQQMSFASIERQEEFIKERLDIEDLSDPDFVKEFTSRFLALWDLQNPNNVSVPPLLSTPFGSQQQGLSLDLLASLQNVKSRF
ncbi:MAG: DUF1217 domain-containing protein [Pseudomonadota bacterium]